jgi:hypothetical protein
MTDLSLLPALEPTKLARRSNSTRGWIAVLLCGLAYPASAVAADAPPAPESTNPAQTGPSRTECLDAHRSAQELRKAGKLLESQEKLLICSSESCPGALITDCGKWLSELDQATPSVVFEVRVDGKDVSAATVELDGHAISDWTQAVRVDPGRHDVRVTVDGFAPYTENVLTPEGKRLKMVTAEFKKNEVAPPVTIPPPKPVEVTRPTPVGTYALLGLGVLGAGGFATFAAMGKTKQNQLDNDCRKVAPCTDGDLKPMKHLYLAADISAGVGLAAFIGAAVVYFTRPTQESSATSFQVGTVDGSRSSFGVSAARVW